MIDVCIVQYDLSEVDKAAFEKTCMYLKELTSVKLNLFIRDNTNDNIGLSRARNELAKQGDSEFVCFMDFDFAKLDINWENLISQCRKSEVGMVFPKAGHVKGEGWTEPIKVNCHMMLMRREVFEELGGFDERFFVAYADWDLIQRMRCAGYRTLQHDESLIHHIGLSNNNPDKKTLWDKDRAVYRQIWGIESLERPENKQEREIIIYDKNGDHHPKWLPNLKDYLGTKGYKVSVVVGVHNDDWWADRVKGCKHLFMWNGAEPQYQPVKAICNAARVGWSVVEVAWFPQSQNWFVDSKGINADAAFMDDDLSWVTDADYEKLAELRKKYRGDRVRSPEDFVLVPLQLEWDTNIVLHSPYKKMQDFINHCEKKFAGQRIIFKQHPHDHRSQYQSKHQIVRSGSVLDYVMRAKEVYGLNSTCLLEAALLEVPVTQLGEGYLKRHAADKEKLLAALAAKQINNSDKDLSRWIDPALEMELPKVPMVVVDTGNADEVRKLIQGRLARTLGVAGDISEADIVITDNVETIEKAGRLGVAVVAYASPDIKDMVNHEKDSFIYLNDNWMMHWVSKLADEDFRKKITTARKEHQKFLDDGVTVVIPCYKQSHLLERSVGSVMRQTDKDFRIIVVDDGSPDDVPAMFAKIKAKWPKADMKLIRQSNRGLAGARNAGFAAACTGWVIPLDADDRLEPKFIEKTLEMQEGTNADVVYTDVTTDNYGFVNMQFQPNELTVRNTVVCTCLTRKDLWEKVGGYDESMRLGFEDWEFWIRCVQAGGRFVKADGGSLFYYHDADQSMLNESFNKQEQIISYMRSKHWKFFGVPRVSIVIPCYKQAHFLDRCIESITRQTEKDVQIIVVDDGSPDDVAGAVAEARLKHGVLIKLVQQENKGLSEARNAGIKKAKAEWILPLDADNLLLEPEWLKNCLDAGKDAGIGVVYTSLKMRSGKVFNSSIHDHERLKKENTLDACALVRKQVLHKLGGYRPRDILEGHEDWDFWLSCIENDIRFKKVNDVHVLYDDVQQERMTPWLQEADTYWRILAKLKELHPKFFTGKAKPKHPRCSLTVVLSSYNQLETMKLVIESYRQQTAWPIEVIVNDDGSTDGTQDWLDSLNDLPFELRYVTREHSWYRLASGNNSAAKHAKGSRILFTNGDQIHSPKSFESHCKLTASRVGGGVFKGIAQGHAQRVTMDMVTNWTKVKVLQENFPSAKNNIHFILHTDPNTNPIGVWGGNFSVPSRIFKQIGGYDEGYDVGWGGEENDLVRRCIKAGCRVEWVKESEIFHLDHPIRAYAHSMLGSRKYIKELT